MPGLYWKLWTSIHRMQLFLEGRIFFLIFCKFFPIGCPLCSAGVPHSQALTCSSVSLNPGEQYWLKFWLQGFCSKALQTSFPPGPTLTFCWRWYTISSSLLQSDGCANKLKTTGKGNTTQRSWGPKGYDSDLGQGARNCFIWYLLRSPAPCHC